MTENELKRWKNSRLRLYKYVSALWILLAIVLILRIWQGNIETIDWLAGFGLIGIGTSFTGFIIGADVAYGTIEKAFQLSENEGMKNGT